MSTPAFSIPSIYCPIAPKIAPGVESVQQYANQWATEFGFITSEKALLRFNRAKFAWLGCRAYADADFEALQLMACWLTFTFMLDDQCEKAVGKDPERLRVIFSELTNYMRAPQPVTLAQNGSLFAALADIWQRTRPHIPTAPATLWSERFIKNVADYLEGNAWEAANKLNQRVPALAEYIEMRQFTVAAYLFFDLFEVTQQLELPLPMDNKTVRLARMANNIIAWFNDIISLEKELPTQDVHNLVVIIQHEAGCSLQTAVDRAVDMHNQEMCDFLELEQQLRAENITGAANNSEVKAVTGRYIDGLRYWIRANVDWSYESGRYLADGAMPEDILITYFTPRTTSATVAVTV